MPNHQRNRRPLLLGQRQELRRELPRSVTVERNEVPDPAAIEDQEQQQWIFGRLAEVFRSFDQRTRLPHSGLGFRRGVPVDMDKWSYERDLKSDLLATQRRRVGQGRDLLEGPGELGRGFGQGRAVERKPSRLAP
jgi:hypothetical protein